jgi:hypothetical protein
MMGIVDGMTPCELADCRFNRSVEDKGEPLAVRPRAVREARPLTGLSI